LWDISLFFSSIFNTTFFLNSYFTLFTISIFFFYLDDFRLSEVIIIKYIQIFSFVSLPFILFFYAYHKTIFIDTMYVKDTNNDINLHGHVTLDKDGAKAIGQGLSTIGSQIGLGATMVGLGGAVGKAVAKSGIPPLQKVGFIVGSGLAAGVGHSLISAANRDTIRAENIVTSSASNVSKLVDDSHISHLQELFFNGEMMSYVCLSIVYLLIIQLMFKFYFKDNINLNLSRLLGNNLNTKIEFYFNKIIKLNKQMSIIWVWYGFITIILGLGVNTYALYKLSINIDSFINGHISFNPNILNDIYPVHMSNSIQDILINLQITNYISIIALVFLILQILLKFHFNKNIKNIYIWLMLLVLILALAFSAHTYGDLYAHINNYVNIYNNIKNK